MNDNSLNTSITEFQKFPCTRSILNLLEQITVFPTLTETFVAYVLSIFPFNKNLLIKLLSYTRLKKQILLQLLQLRLTETESIKIKSQLLPLLDLDQYIFPLINNYHNNANGIVTVTITTCKRIDLFRKTMNSFMNCCLDIDKYVKEWICVDDNSSQEDRKSMQNEYPFIRFICKDDNLRSHARSMNIILSEVKTPFIFHMEDDWKFFIQKNYISECLDVITSEESYAQCLINKNYSELVTDNISGGRYNETNNGTRYYEHEYCVSTEEKQLFIKNHGHGANCNYWPHYSLRPSLLKTDCLINVGRYNEWAPHFEMEYSYRYFEKGYKSVFLEGIYSMHIGRLTSQRFDKTKQNAYILNDVSQFGNHCSKNIDTILINLDRREDRLNILQLIIPTCLNYTRFSAIDGDKLKSTLQLQRIFDGNDYNMKVGMVGCAISHLKIWCDLVNSTESKTMLILEDDITFVDNFKTKFESVCQQISILDWDIVYIGHHSYNPVLFDNNSVNLTKSSVTTSLKKSAGGTFGYLINKSGAIKLLEFINRVGMINCIDTMQQKASDELNVYYSEPSLVLSSYVQSDNKTDTDIQFNTKSLTLSTQQKLIDELEKYKMMGVMTVETKNVLTEVCPENQVNYYWTNNKPKTGNYYTIDDKVLIMCPNTIFIDRLKNNNKWNVDLCC